MHLIADDVAFAYPGRPVLAHVNVRVSAGVRLGIVGENGSGKSTLLRVLAGQLTPGSGSVRRVGTLSVVEQEMPIDASKTVGDLVQASLAGVRSAQQDLESATQAFDHEAGSLTELADLIARAEHLDAWDADRRLAEALSRLGAHGDQTRTLATLSVGERYRVRLACRLAERSDLLLLDEPTNHLDDVALDYLTGVLRSWRGGVVVVTHDRELLDDVSTAILDLDPAMDGRPALYGNPGYAAYRFAKDAALRRWQVRYRQEQKRAARLAARLDESYEGLSDEWRPPKGSNKNRRATRARLHVKAADRLVEKLESEAVDVPVPPPALDFPDLPALPPGFVGDVSLLELRGPRLRDQLHLPGTRVAVPASGRLLITGPNGSGKSTLLRALAGVIALDGGVRSMAIGTRMGVVVQDGAFRQPTSVTATGFEECERDARELLTLGLLDPTQIVPVVPLGLLSEEDLDRPLAELSTGQRRRFEVARALIAAPHVLILDEPTNHLSIDLVDELTQALLTTAAAVVVATHDRRMRSDFVDWPTVALG